jgi:hypothetical protein
MRAEVKMNEWIFVLWVPPKGQVGKPRVEVVNAEPGEKAMLRAVAKVLEAWKGGRDGKVNRR